MALFKQPGSSVWWSRFTLNGQRLRFSTGEYDTEAAQRVEDRRKAAQHDVPKLKGKRWSHAVERWLEVKKPTANEIGALLYFCKHYPDRQLNNVTAESIDKVLSKLCPTPQTFNRHRARIQGVLHLSKLPIEIDKRVEGVRAEPRWLRPEEWVNLYYELPAHQKEWALFAITTGLRQANVLGLTWDKVDLKRGYVWIERNTAKGKKSFTVPLSKEALDVLKTVQGDHPEFCFTYRGKPVTEIKTAFIKACVRAGLGKLEGKNYVGFTWHGFRHTFATWHVQNGTPLDVLQKLGAWSDYRMVLVYAHHAPGYLAGFADNSSITPDLMPEPEED